jgi:hypothetical protein
MIYLLIYFGKYLSLILISDPNLLIILTDPDVYRTIKELIIRMQTDSLYTNKLSNSIQKDDFKTIAQKTQSKNKKDLYSQFNVMIDTMNIRKKDYSNSLIKLKLAIILKLYF